jgi:DASS family divalent anion:Na+ symporter
MSLIELMGSTPTNTPSLGKYLIMCASHSNLLVSSIFITACAPNPIIAQTAKQILKIDISFFQWTLAAMIPGI